MLLFAAHHILSDDKLIWGSIGIAMRVWRHTSRRVSTDMLMVLVGCLPKGGLPKGRLLTESHTSQTCIHVTPPSWRSRSRRLTCAKLWLNASFTCSTTWRSRGSQAPCKSSGPETSLGV